MSPVIEEKKSDLVTPLLSPRDEVPSSDFAQDLGLCPPLRPPSGHSLLSLPLSGAGCSVLGSHLSPSAQAPAQAVLGAWT